MSVVLFEKKRREKKTKEIVSLPVFEKLCLNDKGELVGHVIDYVDLPKRVVREEE